MSTFVFPEATRAAWKKFIKTEIVRPSASTGVLEGNPSGQSNAAVRGGVSESLIVAIVSVGWCMCVF